MQEIERKYLVNQELWQPSTKGEKIVQGYISEDPERTVRVRIKEDKAFLTIKGKSEGIKRTELEYKIPLEDAEVLMKMSKHHPVEKIRYKENHGSFTWEIDVFSGENDGLVLAEIELEHEEQNFELPEWAEKEVSDDRRYYNLCLAQQPVKTW